MLDFNFYSPTYFEFGKNAEQKTGSLLKRFGATNVLIVVGGGKAIQNGLLQRVEHSLIDQQIGFKTLEGIKPNPTQEKVFEGIELCKRNNIDFVLAVGGGSCIDSAKAIAAGVYCEQNFWEVFADGSKVQKALSVGCVLTIAAAGSEASPVSVLTNTQNGKKFGCSSDLLRPLFAVLNPELCSTLPPYQTACGAVDIFAHAMERYFSPTEGGFFTDGLLEVVMRTALETGRKLIDHPNDYNLRANLMWAGTLAHSNVCGVGRVQDWASHAISHSLSSLYDLAHGAALAVIIPSWMAYCAGENLERVASLGANVLGLQRANLGRTDFSAITISSLKRRFADLGLPTSFGDFGGNKKDIKELAGLVRYFEDGSLGRFKRLTQSDVQAILEYAAK